MHQITAIVQNEISEWTEADHRFMQRALALAAKGTGQVSPGPLVGCVLVSPAGEMIGEGFYVYEKLKHAETYALEEAGARARGATVYVSLEPHAHHGRTPPCTDALINAGVSRVISPIEDPNPKVSGKGFAHLGAAGIDVSVGLLAREAHQLNEKYLHFMATGLPFVHLKLASSLDGKIATRTGESQWISGPESRARVHELRHEYDAILVGVGSALADDPLLTDRSGKQRRRPLVRILLDQTLNIPLSARLVTTTAEAPLIIFAGKDSETSQLDLLRSAGVEVVSDKANGRDLRAVLTELGRRSIQSVLVEGGATVAGNLLEAGLVNKASFFLAPIIIGGRDAAGAIGGTGPERLVDALKLHHVEIARHGQDIEVTGYPGKSER
ncbi:MAG: bifunctional diaminohydroxyphosphoribosylaminopyrimidine deaminase/5-amino-6-(5-phosphoribosylamino)uracil reductase RibD [Pyrinomonadaceae bacterium]